jgi:chromatin remodeling complex protein RSC6
MEAQDEHTNTFLTEIVDDIKPIIDSCSQVKTQISMIQNQLRGVEKEVNKKINSLEKTLDKKTKKRTQKHQYGFASPSVISAQLCSFMGHPEGTKIARTDVTKYIVNYIKEKQLQDTQDGRKINPDPALRSLIGDGDITYFNLQHHMNKHFEKAAC